MTIASQTIVVSSNSAPASDVQAVTGFLHRLASRGLLAAALTALLIPLGTLIAATAPIAQVPPRPVARPVILPPSSNARFLQTVQQVQARDSLQKAQVEAQNRQGVSNNSQLPHAGDVPMQNQINQSDAAQQDIERARQQDIIDRYQATPPPLGRVVVPQRVPSKPANGG